MSRVRRRRPRPEREPATTPEQELQRAQLVAYWHAQGAYDRAGLREVCSALTHARQLEDDDVVAYLTDARVYAPLDGARPAPTIPSLETLQRRAAERGRGVHRPWPVLTG